MDFLKKLATESTGNPTENKTSTEQSQSSPSQAELLTSARVVADAARATVQKEQNKVDNAKVAGAAADLLDAAESYGKLDTTTGIGSYVDKAQTYLHQYETSHSTTSPSPPPPSATTAEAGECAAKPSPAAIEGGEKDAASKSEGGYGDVMKMAGDFLKKN